MKIWIHGITGKLGQSLEAELASTSHTLLGGSHRKSSASEILAGLVPGALSIDASSPEGNAALYEAFDSAKLPEHQSVLICTTGLSSTQEESWKKLALQRGIKALFAPNTSLGILLLLKSALQVVGLLDSLDFDIELEETHHRHKKDSPSGTSLLLAKAMTKQLPKLQICTERTGLRKNHEIGIRASRGGGIFGEHTLRFLGEHEELAFTHKAYSRRVFAKGALSLGLWLLDQKLGIYTLEDVQMQSLSAALKHQH